ncbi:MAG: TonB-dependent receptor [Sphingomonadales bacterium]|nr:MAG: TonB-dependent receptor [Sphingomonadales bacterium]
MNRKIGLSACVAMAALFPACALAQTPDTATSPSDADADADANSSDTSSGLDEIIVTARRREERLQDVPVAVSAFGGDALISRGIDATTDMPQVVPSLLLQKTGQAVTPFLRGVGSPAANAGNDPSVATYVDGVYQLVPFSGVYNLSDIQRVEVLKGPQGTLFGRNATGGLLNIVTSDPKPDFGGSFKLSYGNFRTVEAGAYVTGGSDALAASLSLNYKNQADGWGKNLATPDQAGPQLVNGVPVTVPFPRFDEVGFLREFTASGKIVANLGEDTKLTLTARYFENFGDQGEYRRGAYGATLSANGVTPYIFTGGFYDNASDLSYYYDGRQYSFSATLEHDLPFATLKSISSYTNYLGRSVVPSDSTPQIGQTNTNTTTNKVEGFTQELQLLSNGGGSLNWVVGAFYLDSKSAISPTTFTRGALEPTLKIVGAQKTRSVSGFGEITLDIFENTRVTAGLRYTRDKFSAFQYYEGLRTSTIPTPPASFQFGLRSNDVPEQNTTQSAWTYRAVLDHKFDPDIMGYASYSRGFKSGGFNVGGMCLTSPAPLGLCPSIAAPVKPEVLDAYEVGLKTQLFDRHLRLNFASFYYDYQDLQIQVVVGTPPAFQFRNAAAAEIYGGEIEGEAALGPLKINFGVGLIHSKYKNFPDATIFLPRDAAPYNNAQLPNADASGNKLIRAPKFTANLGVSYDTETSFGGLNLSANYYHNSGFFWDAQNRLKEPAYDLFNAQAELRFDGGLSIGIFGKNLTKEKYYSYVRASTDGDQVSPAAPRTYGVTLRYSY